ncbi:MAG: nicotinamide riboside transporter PnuC [Burkholderiaceae bacterium]|nr:nicotinamide riboside transporter PnuC [Burkholderiaceae bacterium]
MPAVAVNPSAAATTVIESAAFVLALGYVLLSIRQIVWAWPLMIVSSVLYGMLFAGARLYGQAALQGVFVAVACWGWWQWRAGHDGASPLKVSALSPRARAQLAAAWAGSTAIAALLLARLTDAASPTLDAFTTLGSLLAQLLTARKITEAWPAWLVVNLVSVTLFVQQALWITALLYAVFVLLSAAGWWQWRHDAKRTAPVDPGNGFA